MNVETKNITLVLHSFVIQYTVYLLQNYIVHVAVIKLFVRPLN